MEIRSQSHSKLPLAGHGRAWQSGGRHSGRWRLVSAVLPSLEGRDGHTGPRRPCVSSGSRQLSWQRCALFLPPSLLHDSHGPR